ncbi:MAG TPA: flagellar biosynthetic protein FliQ [Myxococcaceae bacterium]|nr:flagellar biosynthetic protein FliQ [Myxococcaceae bacterium]
MDTELLLSLGREALWLMVLASLPPIGASLLVGLLSGVLQAVTQVQESTLSVVPKLCAAVLALILCGPWIGAQLSRFAHQVLLALTVVGR